VLTACRAGDTLVVTKLDRLALATRPRAIAEDLTKRKVRLSESMPSLARNASDNSDRADSGKALGEVCFGEYLAVHTDDLADGAYLTEVAPEDPNPSTSRDAYTPVAVGSHFDRSSSHLAGIGGSQSQISWWVSLTVVAAREPLT